MMDEHMPPDLSPAIALATITEQVKSLVEAMGRTERQLEKLDPINTALGEMRVSLALKADTAALSVVDQKLANWIGQFKGALMVATLCMGVVQTLLIGAGAYVITHMQEHETSIAVISQRLDSIDRTLRKDQPQTQKEKTLWAISCARATPLSAWRRD